MKKVIIFSLMFAMTFAMSGVGALASTGTVNTGLTAGQSAGDPPVVKVKWEMKGPNFSGDTYVGTNEGEDDSTDPGAQFNAPGEWNTNMNYTVCAIVTDPNGVGDIDAVYADISYPEHRPMHKSPSNPSDPNYDPDEIDHPTGGCGDFIEENTLKQLDKDDGIDLFCNHVRIGNTNLPEFSDYMDGATIEQMYDEICDPNTGELAEEEAYVYCDDKTLTWEDPAGDYKVEVTGHDDDGPGAKLENHFTYLEFTGFEVDFTSIQYQNVVKDVRNQIGGDRNFEPSSSSMPTVRNIGNTRLNVKVAQDDMDFGYRDAMVWNVGYDARVGNNASDWNGIYDPFKLVSEAGDPTTNDYETLDEILDLSETEKMDFVILVNKWSKGTSHNYSGDMWLEAQRADFDIDCMDHQN